MYNIIKFEFYDIQGFITEGKIGMHRVEELAIPKDISLDDILNDLEERYGESLNDQTEFFHSIFVFVCVRKKIKSILRFLNVVLLCLVRRLIQ